MNLKFLNHHNSIHIIMSTSLASSKGAFEVYDSKSLAIPKFTITFLFNPERLSRSITPVFAESGSTSSGRQDTKTPKLPSEKITLSVNLDASVLIDEKSEIESGNPVVEQYGILPILTALHWLIYPKESGGQSNGGGGGDSGGANFTPRFEMPYVIFVWNQRLRLPVKIGSINITEQQFGPELYPTRAEVQIQMDVLSNDDPTLPTEIQTTYETLKSFREEMLNRYEGSNYNFSR